MRFPDEEAYFSISWSSLVVPSYEVKTKSPPPPVAPAEEEATFPPNEVCLKSGSVLETKIGKLERSLVPDTFVLSMVILLR